MRRYRSEAYEAIHEDVMALFEIGAISEAELREFDEDCFVQEPEESYAAEPSPPLTLSLGS
jgi:putative transcriptional regulator